MSSVDGDTQSQCELCKSYEHNTGQHKAGLNFNTKELNKMTDTQFDIIKYLGKNGSTGEKDLAKALHMPVCALQRSMMSCNEKFSTLIFEVEEGSDAIAVELGYVGQRVADLQKTVKCAHCKKELSRQEFVNHIRCKICGAEFVCNKCYYFGSCPKREPRKVLEEGDKL